MSQRLHVGSTSETWYDCVITDDSDVRERLEREWLGIGHGLVLSPWKIRIGDIALFRKIETIISDVLKKQGRQYPEDVWVFYRHESRLWHPTQEQLREWLYLHE